MADDLTILAEQELRFPFPEPPAPATMTQVAPGIHWIRMPLPLALDHINLWLIEDGDGWTVVDSGFGEEETCGLWRQLFAGLAGQRQPRRLICTHYHPDHFGLAGWLEREFGFAVSMTEKEWIVGNLLARLDDAAFAAGQDRFFARHGIAAEMRAWFRDRGNNYAKRVLTPPDRFRRIRDGEEIAIGGHLWRVIVAEGHAGEHACLHCRDLGVLIAGDQILPEITPNISVHWFKSGSRPLADYLDSLHRLEDLPADTLVLPSHKLPFSGLHTRIGELRWHHAARLAELEAALRDGKPRTATDVLPLMFHHRLLTPGRDRDRIHIMFALGEAVAHLDHLVDLGTLRVETAASGAVRYRFAAGD
jgi:glyoxylase-like metal-dependent hydrolase (beta-lactamase superfamily II)